MTFAYFPSIPIGSDSPKNDRPLMQTNFASIASVIGVDHVAFNTPGGGQHAQVTFNANNVPTPPTSPPVLFTNTVLGLPQPFFYSGDAAHSSTQYVSTTPGSTFLLGGIILKWGTVGFSNGVGSAAATFVSAFPNNFLSLSLLPFTITPSAGVGSVSFGGVGSTAGFTAYRSDTTGVVTYFYIAIGN